ncbi:MAG: SURF1 family protein [Xanthomonadales bacterium]|jgi:surfeit locus 1 family protein|nr:SURF1 family protein [Xanthomonadales bacterium]
MFRPKLGLTLLLFFLAAVFCALGYWQLQRKAEKEILFDQYENAPLMDLSAAASDGKRFAQVEGYGRFDPARHILLDNRIFNGRAGVHVLTPFTLGDGQTILVNRGWLPMPPDRRTLPAVPTDGGPRVVSGRLNRLTTAGPRLGDADSLDPAQWPQLVTYLDREPLEEALGTALFPWLLQMDAGLEGGFEDRQWKAAVMGPETHGAYAVQWFALAGAAVIIWITLGYRETRRRDEEMTE